MRNVGLIYMEWPLSGEGDGAELTRDEAAAEYGEATIDALETCVVMHPERTVALQGAEREIRVDWADARALTGGEYQ